MNILPSGEDGDEVYVEPTDLLALRNALIDFLRSPPENDGLCLTSVKYHGHSGPWRLP